MASGSTFLFTSESVNEGHPGKPIFFGMKLGSTLVRRRRTMDVVAGMEFSVTKMTRMRSLLIIFLSLPA